MRFLFTVIFLSTIFTISTFAQADLAQQYFKKGGEYAKAKNFEKAIEFYGNSLKSVKNDKQLKTKIQYNIGVGQYQLKKYKDAEKSFQKAIKINKKYAQAIYSLGLTQIELKKLNSAESSFRKVIGINAKHSEAWFDLGMVLLEKKKFANAKIAFQQAIKHKTTRLAEAQNNLGVISAMQGNIDLAEKFFRLAYYQSHQTLMLAKQNIDFCKKYKRLELSKLVAIK